MQSENMRMRKSGEVGALMCLSVSMLLASLGTSIANIALPALSQAFDAPIHGVQWVVVSYLATLTLGALVAGRLGDVFGRRRMLIFGLALFSAASLGCAMASSLHALVAARAVQGAGASFLMVLTIALVRDSFASTNTGRAMGLLGTMSALGTALGPSLGGLLIASSGWRPLFLVLIPIGVLTIGMALFNLRPQVPVRKAKSATRLIIPPHGLMTRLLVNFLVAAVMMSTLIVGPFYLGLGLGLAQATTGLVMTVGPAISIICGVPAGRLVDTWGARSVVMIGLTGLTCGVVALIFLPGLAGIGGYLAAIAILTPGYQLFQAANNTAVMADVGEDRRGAVSGMLGFSRNLGLIAGASLMGAIFSYGVGTDAIENAGPALITHGMQLTFAAAAAMMAAAILATLSDREEASSKP